MMQNENSTEQLLCRNRIQLSPEKIDLETRTRKSVSDLRFGGGLRRAREARAYNRSYSPLRRPYLYFTEGEVTRSTHAWIRQSWKSGKTCEFRMTQM
jgi:hypothetical protein